MVFMWMTGVHGMGTLRWLDQSNLQRLALPPFLAIDQAFCIADLLSFRNFPIAHSRG